MLLLIGLLLILNGDDILALRITSQDQAATREFMSHYHAFRRAFSFTSKCAIRNPLCSLPISEKKRLCRDVAQLMYGVNIPEFRIRADLYEPSFACVRKSKIGGYRLVRKRMYLCPILSMDFDSPEEAHNVYIGNGDTIGTIYIFNQRGYRIDVLYRMADVDRVMGVPRLASQADMVEQYYLDHCSGDGIDCSLSMPKIPVPEICKRDKLCDLPSRDKMSFCSKVVSLLYGVPVDNITLNLTLEPSFQCRLKHVTFQIRYFGKPSKRRMYLCPVTRMDFEGKPEDVKDLYISNGHITGTIFVMEATSNPNVVKMYDYILNVYFFL